MYTSIVVFYTVICYTINLIAILSVTSIYVYTPQAAAAAPTRLRRYQVLPAAEPVPVYPESVLWHQGDAHGARLLPSLPE